MKRHAYEIKITPLVDDSQEPDAIPPRKPSDPPVPKDPIPLDVDHYEPAPDGHTIAIIARDPQTPGEKKQKDEKADALWVDHDKHGERLYLLDAESGKLTAVAVASDAKDRLDKKSDRLMALSEGSNHAGISARRRPPGSSILRIPLILRNSKNCRRPFAAVRGPRTARTSSSRRTRCAARI